MFPFHRAQLFALFVCACHKYFTQVRAVFGEDPRKYSVMTTKFLSDDNGNVRGLITVDVEVGPDGIKVSWGLNRVGGKGSPVPALACATMRRVAIQ